MTQTDKLELASHTWKGGLERGWGKGSQDREEGRRGFLGRGGLESGRGQWRRERVRFPQRAKEQVVEL